MTERLIIITPSHDGAPGLWGCVDGDEVLSHGRGAPPPAKGREVVAILAGQSVRLYSHELPATSKRDRLKAAAFSIEDKISQPLDAVHIALDDNRIGVMSKKHLETALAQLTTAGLTPSAVFADFEMTAQDASVLGRAIYSGPLGHTLDEGWEDAPPAKIEDDIFLSQIGKALESGGGLNLLQNEFAAKSSFAANWALNGKILAGFGSMAACLGLAVLALQAVQARALNLQADDLKTQTGQIYVQATGKPAPANPALAATRAQKAGATNSYEFLELSQILFNGVEQVEGLSVDQLRYQKSQNAFQLRLKYPSFESASAFEEAIKTAGGTLLTGGVREQAGEFVGEANLKAGQ